MAEIARTGFCRPVAVKSADAQGDRIALKARQHLVGQRRDTENAIRGLLASLGHRFPKGVGKFAGRVQAILEEYPELGAAIEPLLGAGAVLRVDHRRSRAVRQVARRGGLCRTDHAPLSVGRDGLQWTPSAPDPPVAFGHP